MVRFQVVCDECVRVEWREGTGFVDLPSLVASERPVPVREVVVGDAASREVVVVETSRVRLEYRPDGGRPSAENLRGVVRHPLGDREWRPGMVAKGNLGGTLTTLDGVRGPVALPEGLLAREGWHVLDDSETHLLVDGWVRAREGGREGVGSDWYVFAYGEDFRAGLRAFARVCGRVALPRRCALGSWYSRYWPYSSAEYRGIVAEFDRHGFPLDVMVLDMDWHTGAGHGGWTGWTWNRTLLPDAEELVAWLHHQGLSVTLNLHPALGVGPGEARYGAFMRALGWAGNGETAPFDAADRRYMEALFAEVHGPLEERGQRVGGREIGDTGVDFWWLDWQQEEFTRSQPGLTNLRWLNHLYFRHTSREGRRGMSFSRWAGIGDHRHPIHFSGDSHTGWKMLGFAVPFTVTAGNVGCFFWSHDIGGHFGPRMEETTTRWVQFGALSASLRLHSARSPVLDRRPWSNEDRFCRSMRRAYGLRASLMAYVYSEARRSSVETVPLLRGMYIDWPVEERAYSVPGQYLLGEDLLAAPVVTAGIGERCVGTQSVWVPRGEHGESWFDWSTGEELRAGVEAVMGAEIDETVLLARGGAPIVTRPESLRPASTALGVGVVRVFPGEAGSVVRREVYEDDGVSDERGGSAVTELVAAWDRHGGWNRLRLEVGPTVGDFAGMVMEREWVMELGGVGSVRGVRVDGVEVVNEGARVSAGVRSVRERVVFEVEFERAESGETAQSHRRRRLEAALGRRVDGGDLREVVVAECVKEGDTDLGARVLAIGAGIAAVAEAGEVRVIDSMGWLEERGVDVEIVDRFGAREKVVARERVVLEGGNAGGMRLPSAEIGEPPVGLRGTRLARCRGRMGGSAIVFSSVVKTTLRALTAFRVTGAFAWDWRHSIPSQVHPPEMGRDGPEEWYHGAEGRWFKWTPAKSGAKWAVDLRESLPEGGRGLGYALTTLVSSKKQRAVIEFDSGDKLEAFVNGEKVFSQDGFDTHAAQVGSAEVVLVPGRNRLLVKTADGGGGWGFTLGIDAGEVVTAEVEDGWMGAPMAG